LIDQTEKLNGIAVARDYEIRVLNFGADTSTNGSKVVNFQLWDVTEDDNPFKIGFRYIDGKGFPDSLDGHLKKGDRIIVVNSYERKKQLWKFDFAYLAESDSSLPQNGDIMKVLTKKAFDRNDMFEFVTTGNVANETAQIKKALDNIYTVPDPYISVNTLERKIRNEDEGRGDRRIDFVNLPEKCTISIFTSSGKLVQTLEHDASGTGYNREPWDLRTKDGLEVAFGVYFWVVEAPGIGQKTGKMGIIK
jgi:hypothetical protein